MARSYTQDSLPRAQPEATGHISAGGFRFALPGARQRGLLGLPLSEDLSRPGWASSLWGNAGAVLPECLVYGLSKVIPV